MARCGSCNKYFAAGAPARDNHCRSTGHDPLYECETCTAEFDDFRDRNYHMLTFRHRIADYPYACRFQGCRSIMRTDDVRIKHEHDEHEYCADCNRAFMNQNNLRMHLNSRTHRVGMSCPLCKTASFASATGLTHHLERGSCPKGRGLNRDTIYAIVRDKDPNGVISKKLIGWTGSTRYSSNERAWNGSAYECYLCHRGFSSLNGLNQHLESPAHQQVLYHCPNRRACGRDFKTLAAIFNHLESETCGFMRFDAVQNKVGQLIDPNRRLAF